VPVSTDQPFPAVFSLVKRDGNVRSFHVAKVNGRTLRPIITEHVNQASALMTRRRSDRTLPR
jgi:hypothetical protein